MDGDRPFQLFGKDGIAMEPIHYGDSFEDYLFRWGLHTSMGSACFDNISTKEAADLIDEVDEEKAND